eukprot:1157862-Pelagomonas_calceolata.AAC.13
MLAFSLSKTCRERRPEGLLAFSSSIMHQVCRLSASAPCVSLLAFNFSTMHQSCQLSALARQITARGIVDCGFGHGTTAGYPCIQLHLPVSEKKRKESIPLFVIKQALKGQHSSPCCQAGHIPAATVAPCTGLRHMLHHDVAGGNSCSMHRQEAHVAGGHSCTMHRQEANAAHTMPRVQFYHPQCEAGADPLAFNP